MACLGLHILLPPIGKALPSSPPATYIHTCLPTYLPTYILTRLCGSIAVLCCYRVRRPFGYGFGSVHYPRDIGDAEKLVFAISRKEDPGQVCGGIEV